MKYEKPTREQVISLYKKIRKDKSCDRNTALSLMSESTGNSRYSCANWIDGRKVCSASAWRCLLIDWGNPMCSLEDRCKGYDLKACSTCKRKYEYCSADWFEGKKINEI